MTTDNDLFELDEDVDDIGYTEYDWANLSEEETNLHDEIIEANSDYILGLDFSKLTDLQLWAAAQVLLDDTSDETDKTGAQGFELARGLIFGARQHPAIDYYAIATEFCFDAIMENDVEEARKILGVIHELAESDDSTPLEFEAMILFAEGNEKEANQKYQDIIDEYGDDPEVLLNLASQFAMFGAMDRAHATLDQAEELARNENDQELIEVIEDLRVRIDSDENDED